MSLSAQFDPSPLRFLVEGMSQRERRILGEDQYIKTAVMVPLLVDGRGNLAVLFERRAATLRRQPSEVSFPGGHWEPGDNQANDTAVRETQEELGVLAQDIQILGALDVVVARSGLLVYPFVGYLPKGVLGLSPNPAEVEGVFTLSVSDLLAATPDIYRVGLQPVPPENFPFDLIPDGRQYAWRPGSYEEVFYRLDGQVVWGLTARILRHFLQVWREWVPSS